jgi:hypothetical protein
MLLTMLFLSLLVHEVVRMEENSINHYMHHIIFHQLIIHMAIIRKHQRTTLRPVHQLKPLDISLLAPSKTVNRIVEM